MIKTIDNVSKTKPIAIKTAHTTITNSVLLFTYVSISPDMSCGILYKVIAFPNILAPAIIIRIAAVVTIASKTARLKSLNESERLSTTVKKMANAKPTAAASVGVKIPA